MFCQMSCVRDCTHSLDSFIVLIMYICGTCVLVSFMQAEALGSESISNFILRVILSYMHIHRGDPY